MVQCNYCCWHFAKFAWFKILLWTTLVMAQNYINSSASSFPLYEWKIIWADIKLWMRGLIECEDKQRNNTQHQNWVNTICKNAYYFVAIESGKKDLKKSKYALVLMTPFQIVMKETPRNRPRVPPTSATMVDEGYRSSSFSTKVYLVWASREKTKWSPDELNEEGIPPPSNLYSR